MLTVQHRSIETLCRDIQTYKMTNIDLDQVPTSTVGPYSYSPQDTNGDTFKTYQMKNIEVVKKVIKTKLVLVTLQVMRKALMLQVHKAK